MKQFPHPDRELPFLRFMEIILFQNFLATIPRRPFQTFLYFNSGEFHTEILAMGQQQAKCISYLKFTHLPVIKYPGHRYTRRLSSKVVRFRKIILFNSLLNYHYVLFCRTKEASYFVVGLFLNIFITYLRLLIQAYPYPQHHHGSC